MDSLTNCYCLPGRAGGSPAVLVPPAGGGGAEGVGGRGRGAAEGVGGSGRLSELVLVPASEPFSKALRVDLAALIGSDLSPYSWSSPFTNPALSCDSVERCSLALIFSTTLASSGFAGTVDVILLALAFSVLNRTMFLVSPSS
jgi:hypothetical protein